VADGPVCPHCGNCAADKIGRLNGKTSRPGLRKCYECLKTFTVKMGSIFEDSHAPLHLWLQAIHLMCSSKKGISTRQLQRTLGVGMKTAWFMGHRIRFAMAPAAPGKIGGEGTTVEADETYLAKSPKTRKPRHAAECQACPAGFQPCGARRQHPLHVPGRQERSRGALVAHLHPQPSWSLTARPYTSFRPTSMSRLIILSTNGRVVMFTRTRWRTSFPCSSVGWSEPISTWTRLILIGIWPSLISASTTRAKLGVNDTQRAAMAVQGFKGKRLTYAAC
jgi:transposase-like protein